MELMVEDALAEAFYDILCAPLRVDTLVREVLEAAYQTSRRRSLAGQHTSRVAQCSLVEARLPSRIEVRPPSQVEARPRLF